MSESASRAFVDQMEQDLAVLESEHHLTSASVRELQSQIKKLSDDLNAERERRRQLAMIVAELVSLMSHYVQGLSHARIDPDELESVRADASENARR